jgi:iron complex transport system permease protein
MNKGMNSRYFSFVVCCVLLLVLLFFGNLFYGSVHIPAHKVWEILTGNEVERLAWTNIVIQSRLPQAITAVLAGAALSVSGLMLQTLFQNPLAGPSILGISDGANLGVAIVMLYMGGTIGRGAYTVGGSLAVVLAALIGAMAVLALIVYFSGKLKNNIMVLIIGMMIAYLASSGIAILNFMSSAESVRSYVMWGMGNFSGVALKQIPLYASMIFVGITGAVLLIKPLNALLLGERYAANLGIPIKRARMFVLLCTGLLTGVVTAFCGPVSFIGLAVPHVARLMLRTSNHQVLLPVTLLLGAIVALTCNILTILPFGQGVLPLNAITPVLGAPVIIYIIVNRKHIQYFN